MNYTEIVKNALKDKKGFIGNNNYNVVKVEKNYCELEGIISETSYNNLNIAHGGYIFGLADTAAGIAAMTNECSVVTINSNIEFLKPANGNRLIAKASSIKTGKTILVYEVLIYNEKEDLISKAMMTFYNVGEVKI